MGSLLRTAEGLGATKLYFTGYTPYPEAPNDPRLPHLRAKIERQIHKTALGAEQSMPWEQCEDVFATITRLQKEGYTVVAVEQAPQAVPLPNFKPAMKIALLVGREVEGVEADVLARCNRIVEIPMFGRKESFNVAQAAAMALYHCRFAPEN